MRRSIELGILLVSVLLALSIFVALAENQTAKDKLNATKLNTTNGTTNLTEKNTTAATNQTAMNKTTNNTTNMTNPFANVKGHVPKP
ncbi:MAG: hypothetical protein WB392_13220 [Methanotrichaceae archaeon]